MSLAKKPMIKDEKKTILTRWGFFLR